MTQELFDEIEELNALMDEQRRLADTVQKNHQKGRKIRLKKIEQLERELKEVKQKLADAQEEKERMKASLEEQNDTLNRSNTKRRGRSKSVSHMVTQEEAAVDIQRYFRGYSARKKQQSQREAAIEIQRHYRGYKTRKHSDHSAKQRRGAVDYGSEESERKESDLVKEQQQIIWRLKNSSGPNCYDDAEVQRLLRQNAMDVQSHMERSKLDQRLSELRAEWRTVIPEVNCKQ